MNTGQQTDQEWARGLFERSRQGEEPAWVADHAAMMQAGKRRNRVRALTASGSVLATAAAVAVVAIGVGAGAERKAPSPSPGQSVTSTPTKRAAAVDPANVLNYAEFGNFSMKPDNAQNANTPNKEDFYIPVSTTTARDTMQMLSELDPALAHIAKRTASGQSQDDLLRLVPDDDPLARSLAGLGATVWWTNSGVPASVAQSSKATVPTGTLSLSFVDSTDEGPAGGAVCVSDGVSSSDLLHPVRASNTSWTDTVQWSPCLKSTLHDGSTLLSTTKSYGPFYVATVARRFPGTGGETVLTWTNYASGIAQAQNGPDPSRALSPNPVTVDKLVAALSDPSIGSPLT